MATASAIGTGLLLFLFPLSASRGGVCGCVGGWGGAPSSANVTSLDTCCSEQLGSFIRTLCTCAASFLEMECVRVMLHLMGGGQADRLVSGRTPTDLKCLLLNVCCDTRGCFPVSTAQTRSWILTFLRSQITRRVK